QRQEVDNGPLRTSHERQEGLGHAVCTEKVDREVPFEVGAFAQVFVKVHSSVVDQDVERFDFLDSVLNLRGVGHVQSQLRDAPIGMGKGWRVAACTRFAPLFKASSTSARPMPRFAPVIKIVLFSMFITFSFRIIVPSIGYYASLGREDTSQAKDFGSTPLRLLEAAPQCRPAERN